MNNDNSENLLVISEEVCRQVVSKGDAFTAVEQVFAAMARDDAYNFPVIREAIGHKDALYGFKSGFDRVRGVLGLKAGGYWPHNMEHGLTNHQSAVFLFDPDSGRVKAIIGGNYLTAVRTAAASAVSIAHLARKDAKTIGIIGAGHQSAFQLHAATGLREFTKIVAWNRTPEPLSQLASVAEELGLPFQILDREALCAQADVIITMTAAHEALIAQEWVKPGTHIACMGADTKGKQETDPTLVAKARLFTDEIAQSISIGECQHAFENGLIGANDITPLGAVINGDHSGRKSDDDITLFDGTGVGLQDLSVANAAIELAIAEGTAQKVTL